MPGSRNNSLKNPELYEELRQDGNSKQKAARISNAAAQQGATEIAKKGGESGSYDDWRVRVPGPHPPSFDQEISPS